MSAARVRGLLRAIQRGTNPALAAFARDWDGSVDGIDRFRRTLPDRPEPSSIRDEADDVLADLAAAVRAVR